MSQFRMSIVVFSQALIFGLGASLSGASAAEALPAADWLIETIDATREVGYNVSVAVDPETGHTYISYYEGIDGDLWLARTGAPVGNCGPGNTWECQVLDADGVVGKYSSIAVLGDGPVTRLYIIYHDVTNGALKEIEGSVERTTGTLSYVSDWVEIGVPGSGIVVGTKTSIDIRSVRPYIAYQVEVGTEGLREVMWAVRLSPGMGTCRGVASFGRWMCAVVESEIGIGDYVDLDIGPDGSQSIAFSTTNDNGDYPMIATRGGTGVLCDNHDWSCTKIRPDDVNHDTGQYVALEVLAGGVKHLAYRNATTESLEWAKYVGPFNGNCGPGDESYQCERIDDIGPGTSPAGIDLKIDSDGNPIIAYQDVESGFEDLKIARPLSGLSWPAAGNCGPLSPTFFRTWLCETLETGSLASSYAHGGLSIALNANDEAVVAYRELFDPIISPEEGRLKIALEHSSIFLDGFESGSTVNWSVVAP